MQVQSTSPFANFINDYNRINSIKQQPQNTQVKILNPERNNKQKNIEKFIKIALVATALAVLLSLLKGHIDNKMISNITDGVKKEADELAENSKKLYKETMNLYHADCADITQNSLLKITEDEKGNIIRKILFTPKSHIMEEFSENNEPIRRTVFTQNNVQISKNYQTLSNGTKDWTTNILFQNGVLNCLQEGCDTLIDGTEKIEKEISFKNGIPKIFRTGVVIFGKKVQKIKTAISFFNGKPNLYASGYSALEDSEEKFRKVFSFVEDRWISTKDGFK